MKLRVAGVLACLLLISQAIEAKEHKHTKAGILLYGPTKQPGVEAGVEFHISEAKQGGQRRATPESLESSNPTPSAVALAPHSCTPIFDTGGVSLSYSFAEAGAGDCVYFAPPPPPERFRPDRPRRRNRPTPEQIARNLYDRARALAPRPRLRMAPGAIGLTGLPSYFWIRPRPRPITAQASVAGFTVTAQAYPIRYIWDFDDGNERSTRKPGRRWTRRHDGNIAHTYETKRFYRPSVEVIWIARWRLGGGAWRPLGYFSASDDAGYPVREIVPLLVRPR